MKGFDELWDFVEYGENRTEFIIKSLQRTASLNSVDLEEDCIRSTPGYDTPLTTRSVKEKQPENRKDALLRKNKYLENEIMGIAEMNKQLLNS